MKRLALACLASVALLVTAAAPVAPAVNLDRLLEEKPAAELDEYNLFRDAGGRSPNTGLTPFAPSSALFSDYAEKFRFVYLPPSAKAKYRETGVLEFPVGTTLVKTFAYPADFRQPNKDVRYLETRLLIRRASGWVPLTYVWNAEQTEAVLKRAGARIDVAFTDAQGKAVKVDYAVPNANQCKECHSVAEAIAPIGPKARNLNSVYAYADGAENQLARWTRLGLLEGSPAPSAVRATGRWTDTALSISERAHAYLDANCAHCHSAEGIANNSGLFLDLEQTDPVTRGVGKRPVAAGRGSGDLEFDILPGQPDQSILIHRMESTDPGVMMPELGRSTVHAEAVALMREYVRSLPAETKAATR